MKYWLKIANITSFGAAAGVTSSEFHSQVSCGKTRMMGYQAMKKV